MVKRRFLYIKKIANYYFALIMATYLKVKKENQNKAIKIFNKIENYNAPYIRSIKID